MIAFAMVAAWIAYAVGMYGYILVRGYDLSVWQVVSPTNYYTGKWPPPNAPNTVIFPSGKGGANAGSTSTAGTQGGINSPVANQEIQSTIQKTGNPVAVQAGAANNVLNTINNILKHLGFG